MVNVQRYHSPIFPSLWIAGFDYSLELFTVVFPIDVIPSVANVDGACKKSNARSKKAFIIRYL